MNASPGVDALNRARAHWNAGNLDGYLSLYRQDAVLRSQARRAAMIVVDTDVMAHFWLHLASEQSAAARLACRRDADWVAPHLWRSEFR